MTHPAPDPRPTFRNVLRRFARRVRLRATLVVALALLPALPALARDCAAEGVSAPAEIWIAGAWRPLARGPLPAEALILRTGPRAHVLVTCTDGVRVTLGERSEFSLGTLTESAHSPDRSIVMRLVGGIVGVAAKGAWPKFEVQAPLAIAAVRSTEWLVMHDETAGSAVFVREGAVRVRPLAPGAPVTLSAGEGVDIARGAGMGPVRRWPEARVAAAAARLGPSW